MALQGQRQLICRHATAIIADPDQAFAAIGDFNGNPARPSIKRVFHQLFHRRGRSLDHLTGGNTVDRTLVQLADNRGFLAYVGCVCCHDTKPSMDSAILP